MDTPIANESDREDHFWVEVSGGSRDFNKLLWRNDLYRDASYKQLALAIARIALEAPADEHVSRLRHGLEILDGIMEAVTPAIGGDGLEAYDRKSFVRWRHRDVPSLHYKKPGQPYISLYEVREVTASYLHMGYRVPKLDRLLVDMLIAAEMFAYVDEVLPTLRERNFPTVLRCLWNNLVTLATGAGIAVAIYAVAPDNELLIAGVVGITLVLIAWSLIAFPFLLPTLRANREKIVGPYLAMIDAYQALNGEPTSIKHLDERLRVATNKGVFWPPQLIVLVEDIASRSKTV